MSVYITKLYTNVVLRNEFNIIVMDAKIIESMQDLRDYALKINRGHAHFLRTSNTHLAIFKKPQGYSVAENMLNGFQILKILTCSESYLRYQLDCYRLLQQEIRVKV